MTEATTATHSELNLPLIQNTIKVLESGDPQIANVYKILDRMDPVFAAETAALMKKAIAESSNLDAQKLKQLKVNMLINAFEHLKKEAEVEAEPKQTSPEK